MSEFWWKSVFLFFSSSTFAVGVSYELKKGSGRENTCNPRLKGPENLTLRTPRILGHHQSFPTIPTGSSPWSPEFSLRKRQRHEISEIPTAKLFTTAWNAARDGASLLAVGLLLGDDGQQEGGRLVGSEGGRYDQVLCGLQREVLHHLAGVPVGFGLAGWRLVEERWRKLPLLCLVL